MSSGRFSAAVFLRNGILRSIVGSGAVDCPPRAPNKRVVRLMGAHPRLLLEYGVAIRQELNHCRRFKRPNANDAPPAWLSYRSVIFASVPAVPGASCSGTEYLLVQPPVARSGPYHQTTIRQVNPNGRRVAPRPRFGKTPNLTPRRHKNI